MKSTTQKENGIKEVSGTIKYMDNSNPRKEISEKEFDLLVAKNEVV